MDQAKFRFVSEVTGGEPGVDRFSVVSFTGHEAISSLYRYEIELKIPLSAAIDLDDMLDSRASFITEVDGEEHPVHGVLSSLDELQTVLGYVYFRAVLTPRLWSLSTYKTNEIYTEEKTVDQIVRTVLESAGLAEDFDYDFNGLNKDALLQRDYICQFGESDFDFISRLMENEGISYYFDQTGLVEKIMFINDMNYEEITKPGLIYDVAVQTNRLQDSIHAWICRRQRLAASVTVRDFNPNQPSLDISDTRPIDNMGHGTEYIYGCQVNDTEEAAYLTQIRAEEQICTKTRYYAESSVSRLRTGYLFDLSLHPNDKYNGGEYLVTEITHEGLNLDLGLSATTDTATSKPQYHNSFTAISTSDQYRPPRITAKPRFYGTMTAFVHAEAASGMVAELDEQGRYRVHLPFDRANGTKDSLDPDRKASAWMRMAQPYVGENEGTYFPLKGGTEVLLTFINGDPDQPIISGALPNAAMPSLLNHENAHVTTIKTSGGIANVSGAGSYTNRSIPVTHAANQASASALNDFRSMGAVERNEQGNYSGHFMPPADFIDEHGGSSPLESNTQFPFTQMNDFGQASNLPVLIEPSDEINCVDAHIDRSTGPMYTHRVGSTFTYPQQERVYFSGTFHEEFHMDDLGIIGLKRDRDENWLWTDTGRSKVDTDPQGEAPEVFHFPEPNKDGSQTDENGDPFTAEELARRFPPNRVRGVTEEKHWGEQLTYMYGRKRNWSGGAGAGGSFELINYGNGTTEDLINTQEGRFKDCVKKAEDNDETLHWDLYQNSSASPTSEDFDIPDGLSSTLNSSSAQDYADTFYDEANPSNSPGALYNFVDGNTYSYQHGDDLDVNDGKSDSWVFGNSRDYVFGHSYSWVKGNSYSDVQGNSISNFMGDADNFTMGQTSDIFLGTKTEISIAGIYNAELSATIGINAAKDTRTDLWADSVAAKKQEATLKKTISSLLTDINSAKYNLKAIQVNVKAAGDYKITAASIDLNALIIRQQGKLVTLG
jgi:type VI secretion system VgrG family protein